MLNANENGTCGRAEALVTYLYGEMPEAEVADFHAHTLRCEQCSVELAEFEGTHRSMADWRDATLGQMAVPSISPELWQPVPAAPVVASRTSWVSAVRDLFAATPGWAQAGLAVAALVVIAISAFLLLQPNDRQPLAVAQSFFAGAVQSTLTPPKQADEVAVPEHVANKAPSVPRRRTPPSAPSGGQLADNRSLPPAERNQELASLTRDLLSPHTGERDTSVPRLSDILSDGDTPMMEPNH